MGKSSSNLLTSSSTAPDKLISKSRKKQTLWGRKEQTSWFLKVEKTNIMRKKRNTDYSGQKLHFWLILNLTMLHRIFFSKQHHVWTCCSTLLKQLIKRHQYHFPQISNKIMNHWFGWVDVYLQKTQSTWLDIYWMCLLVCNGLTLLFLSIPWYKRKNNLWHDKVLFTIS